MSARELPQSGLHGWRLSYKFARRKIKGTLNRFRVFLAALILGVAAIGTVGSLAEAVRSGMEDNTRTLLGGHFELASNHSPPPQSLVKAAEEIGTASLDAVTDSVLQVGERYKFVALRGVEDAWPLVGEPETESGENVHDQLDGNRILVVRDLLLAMDLEVGDEVKVGGNDFEIAGVITYEPDRAVDIYRLGHRVMMSMESFRKNGFDAQGSVVRYALKVELDDPSTLEEASKRFRELIHNTGVHFRGLEDAAPAIIFLVARAEVFLIMVGLTVLLIGGLGIASGVRSWLDSKIPIIATMKCLGACKKLVFKTYLLQIMIITGIGTIIGMAIASVLPAAALWMIGLFVTIPVEFSIYPIPLLVAGAFGMTVTFLFVTWPLSLAGDIKPSTLFRQGHTLPSGKPTLANLLMTGSAVALILALTLYASGDWQFTLAFLSGAAFVLLVLNFLSDFFLDVLGRFPKPRNIPLKIALSAITRDCPLVKTVVIAFGLGLSVLMAVSLTQTNMARELTIDHSETAPDLVLANVQPNQVERALRDIENMNGVVSVKATPSLLVKVSEIAGMRGADFDVGEPGAWLLRRDVRISWSDEIPEGNTIVDGEWWSRDHTGPTEVSLHTGVAESLGATVGDEMTLNVLGRDIDGRITNLRDFEYDMFSPSFSVLLSPGLIEKAPHEWLVAIKTEGPQATAEVEKYVADGYKNVSAVSVQQTINSLKRVVSLLRTAVNLTALVTLVAGVIVLAGTVASTEAQRLSDSAVMKLLGTTRKSIFASWILEYTFLGLVASVVAIATGIVSSWILVTFLLKAKFTLSVATVVATGLAGIVTATLFGITDAARMLGHKSGTLMREIK